MPWASHMKPLDMGQGACEFQACPIRKVPRVGGLFIGSASEDKVAGFVWYICALNLQKILEVMASC